MLGDLPQVAVPLRGRGHAARHGVRTQRDDGRRFWIALGHAGGDAVLLIPTVAGERGRHARDQAGAGFGAVIKRTAPSLAQLSMPAEPRMLNGHGACHGGFTFSLADSAFACNSDGLASVASHCSISFLRPARQGERLLATAHECCREGSMGVCDVRVTAGEAIIAEVRSHSRTAERHRFAVPASSTPPAPPP